MKRPLTLLAAPGLLLLAAVASPGQFYKLHNADVAGSGVGQFTTVMTNPISTDQMTTNSFGGLFTVRDQPVAWAGIEVNYGYHRFSEIYSAYGKLNGDLKTNDHEATAAYMLRPHYRKLKPFVGVGGGGLSFVPLHGDSQWRGVGLLEFGLEIPTSNPYFGFRVSGRTLYYRAPNYNRAPPLSSESWVVTTEPALGAYIRF